MSICQGNPGTALLINVDRESTIGHPTYKIPYSMKQQRRRNGGGNNFQKGVAKPDQRPDRHGGRRRPDDDDSTGFKRAEISEEQLRLQKEALRHLQEAQELTKKQDPVLTKIKLHMNQITPDNKKKKLKDLEEIMKKNFQNEAAVATMAKTIFTKAQNEDKYGDLYSQVVDLLVRTQLMGTGKMSSSKNFSERKKHQSKSSFYQLVMELSRQSFQLFMTDLDVPEDDEDFEEKHIIHKKKLIGSMKFIGRLFMERLIKKPIIQSVIVEFF